MQVGVMSKRDRWIPWMIVAFFACFIVILSFFAWIAFHTYTGEVTDNAYKKGLVYNADIAHANVQAQLGWKSALDINTQNRTVEFIFTLHDANDRPINDAVVVAYVTRPTQAGHDRHINLKNDGNTYRGAGSLEWNGAWNIRISATVQGFNYQRSRTIILQ